MLIQSHHAVVPRNGAARYVVAVLSFALSAVGCATSSKDISALISRIDELKLSVQKLSSGTPAKAKPTARAKPTTGAKPAVKVKPSAPRKTAVKNSPAPAAPEAPVNPVAEAPAKPASKRSPARKSA